MLRKGNVGPTGTKLPPPDLLLLSYTGCFTFMKWFELLREQYSCPVVMLHVPYQPDGRITTRCAATSWTSCATGDPSDGEASPGGGSTWTSSPGASRSRRQAEEDLVAVWESAKHRPSPIDGYFGGVYYVGPIFSAFRGTEDGRAYYRELRAEVEERVAPARGRRPPTAPSATRSYRLVVEGPPNWTSFNDFWRMFSARARWSSPSTYTQGGRPLRRGLPPRPGAAAREPGRLLPRLLHQPLPAERVSLLERYLREYSADGFLINSVKSCNSFSVGQLLDAPRPWRSGPASRAASSSRTWSIRATSARRTSRTGSRAISRCSRRASAGRYA
jgi:benzoyl-CoA reductase subunit B